MKYSLSILVLIIFAASFLPGCQKREYHIDKTDNPVYRPNTVFISYEDLRSPRFEHLRKKYRLDTIFHGEKDELRRILLLRHWIRTVIPINNNSPHYSGDGYVEGILDAALEGEGFHCGHFMVVQNAVMNAFGYVTRCLGAGPGVPGGPDGHHGINEIWLNKYHKWFLSDAKYDHHFEKDGIPLSALEIRDEYLKNKGADIVMVRGPERRVVEKCPDNNRSKEDNARTYTWVEWHKHNNIFTVWPDFQTALIMYEDDYFRNHTWYWGGGPHWAYGTPYLTRVRDRTSIEWTPNTITSSLRLNDDRLQIILSSDTPNLKGYEMKELPAGEWHSTPDTLVIKLKKKHYAWTFRTVNLAGVTGPEHTIRINAVSR